MNRLTELAITLLFSAPIAVANETTEVLAEFSFEQLLSVEVETAGKVKQQADDAPAIISIVSQRDIQAFGANSLLEVLDRLPSLQMLGSFFYPQNLAVIRGQQLTHSNNEVLVLINGRPLRDSFTGGQNFAIFSSFPVNSIAQIEIIRGPGSVLYGSNAFTGVINIITHKTASKTLSFQIGSDDFIDLDTQITSESLDGHWSLAAKMQSESGWQHSAFDNSAVAGSFNAGEQNYSLAFNGAYQDFTWSGVWLHSEQDFWGATSSWTGSPPQQQRQVRSNRLLLDAGYKWQINSEQYIETNASFASSSFSHYNYDAKSQNWLFESTYHHTQFNSGHLLAGVTIWHQNVETFDGLRVAPIPQFSRNWVNAYSQYQTKREGNLNGFVGVQYNKVPNVDANWVFRGGLHWQLSKQSGLKILWGEAFRAAYSVETHFDLIVCCDAQGNNRGGLRGNPSLEPEEITTMEIQYYLNSEKGRFAVTLFESELSNLIERERAADRVLDFVNAGSMDSSGIEFEWRRFFSESTYLDASVTYQNNEAKGIDNYTLMPNWLFKLGYSIEFKNQSSLGLFLNSQDKFHQNTLRNPASQRLNPEAEGRHELSVQYRHPIYWFHDEQSHLIFKMTNALDEELYQPEFAGRSINTHPAGAGRRIYLGVQSRF